MKMSVLSPTVIDAEIPDDMDPQMYLNVDWLQIRKTPAAKVDITKEDLRGSKYPTSVPNAKSKMLIY